MIEFTVWGTSFAKPGNEAQLAATCRLLQERYPQSRVVVLDRPRPITKRLYPELRTVRLGILWRSLPQIARCHTLVVVGAPFFESARQVAACLLVFATAKLFKTRIVCLCISVFDYQTHWGRTFFSRLFEWVDVLAVREQIGIDILKRIGVHKQPILLQDQRCLMEPAPAAEIALLLQSAGIDPQRTYIVVTTRYMDDTIPKWVKHNQSFGVEKNHRANEEIGRLVARLADLSQVVILPMHKRAEDDEAMFAVVRRFSESPEQIRTLARGINARQCLGVLAQAEMAVSCRLVSAVFGVMAATPTLAIAYDDRMTDFMTQVEAQDRVVHWHHLDAAQLEKLLMQIWGQRKSIRSRSRARLTAMRAELEKQLAQLNIANDSSSGSGNRDSATPSNH